MFDREPNLPIDSMFETTEPEGSNKTTRAYLQELKERLKETQEIVNRVTDKVADRQKEVYDRRAKAARIEVGDNVLVKILAFEGRHKIADKFDPDLYQVIAQPNKEIPVYEIRSPAGVIKKLQMNHLLPVGYVNNRFEKEEKGISVEEPKSVQKPKPIPRVRKSLESKGNGFGRMPAREDSTVKRQSEEYHEKQVTSLNRRMSAVEYVVPTYYGGDALRTELRGEPEKRLDETERKEAEVTRRTSVSETDSDPEEEVNRESSEESDHDTEDESPSETTEKDEVEEREQGLRRSTTTRKRPAWFGDFHVNQQQVSAKWDAKVKA